MNLNDARDAVNVLVLVDSEVVGGDAAFGNDGGGLKHDEAGAPLRASAEVNHVPVVWQSRLARSTGTWARRRCGWRR